MNILIIGSDFKPLCGGVAEYTHQLALQLHQAKDNVVVLSTIMNGYKQFDSTCPYVVYRTDLNFLSSGKITKYIEGYRWLKEFVKSHRPIDIIISNCREILSIIALAVSKSLKIPFVIFTYGLEINRKEIKEKLKTKYLLQYADRVFCISLFTQELVTKTGVPVKKMTIIPPAISFDDLDLPHEKFDGFTTDEFCMKGKNIIFTCSRIVERKGHDMIIKALPKVLQKIPDTVYVIAGEGPYENQLKKLVHEYRLKESVVFKGRIDNNTRKELYKTCRIFVMPSRALKSGDVEGFGIVFLEANAYGKPVIAGKSGGTADAVVHNKTGFIVDPLDIEAIANALIYLLSHPKIATRMGMYGRKRIEQQFTWYKSGTKLRHALLDI